MRPSSASWSCGILLRSLPSARPANRSGLSSPLTIASQHRSPALAHGVGHGAGKLDVGALQQLLDAAADPGLLLRERGSGSRQIPQVADHRRRNIAATQQTMSEQLGYPLAVHHVGFTAWDRLDVLSVSKHHLEVFFEHVPYRLPINACRLHSDMSNVKAPEPLSWLTQVSRCATRCFWGLCPRSSRIHAATDDL